MTYTRDEMEATAANPYHVPRTYLGEMIRQLLAENEWQPIATAPTAAKLGPIQMLVSHEAKRWIRMGRFYPEIGKWYYSGTNERSQWAEVEGDAPTHWRPLPAPPKGGER